MLCKDVSILRLVKFALLSSAVYSWSIEEKLIANLTRNVSRFARPVINANHVINATFGMELFKLVKVNDREQLITTEVWVRQNWQTEIFKWNPEEWGGISRIQLDAKMVWTPDIILQNNGDSEFAGGQTKYKTLVNVYSNGLCTWGAPAKFTSSCAMDLKEFPFDEQTCTMTFLSWTFDTAYLNLDVDDAPLLTGNYLNSTEWKIKEATSFRADVYYECCEHPFSHIVFKFVLRRKSLYYVFNVISPCLLLVCAILFGFFLHPESGERISLTITVLLAISVFLQLVSEALPRNSDSIPMLAVFYIVMMAECVLSLLATCLVLVQHSGTSSNPNRMPKWIKIMFFDYLAKLLCVNVDRTIQNDSDTLVIKNDYWETPIIEDFKPFVENRQNDSFQNASKTIEFYQEQKLSQILKELRYMSSEMLNQKTEDETLNEWKLLAKVLDRLFFWCFFLTIVMSVAVIIFPVYLKQNDK